MIQATIRFGRPADADALAELERTHFPEVPGTNHSGYVFDNRDLASVVLTEEIARPMRSFILVAEVENAIVGMAVAVPSRFPGGAGIDPETMLLQYLVVVPEHRRAGIASTLLLGIEQMAIAARQNLLIAHVPHEADFYAANGWSLQGEGYGYAWIPFMSMLRADTPDPDLGFSRMAAKVLRPKAVRMEFPFLIKTGAPGFDAASELSRLIDSKAVDPANLDADTLDFVKMARLGPLPDAVRKPFGLDR